MNNDICIYVGSTYNISHRQQHHRQDCKNGVSFNIYDYCRKHNLTITLTNIEEIDVETIEEVRKKEQEYIRQLKPLCNQKCAFVDEMRKKEMKEWAKNYNKEYRIKNREKLTKYNKEWYEANKEEQKRKAREYREANKEERKRKAKIYNDKKRAFNNEKIQCTCGCMVSRRGLTRHKRSNKHKKLSH